MLIQNKFNLKWEEFDVMLNGRITPLATDQTLSIENGILRIDGKLILGCIADETLSIWCESYVWRRYSITLVIGDDFNTAILEHSNTKKNSDLYER